MRNHRECQVIVVTNKEIPVNTARIPYNNGDKNMNENSIGSVIPVKNEVNARPPNIPVTILRFSALAAAIIAKHAAG